MKKITLLFSAILVFTLSFYSCDNDQSEEFGQDQDFSKPFTEVKSFDVIMERSCGDAEVCDLKYGQHTKIGTVSITNDNEYLYVEVYSEEGFNNDDQNIKMWVGTDLADMPRNKPGNPVLGDFPYVTQVPIGQKTFIYRIELSTIDDWNNEVTDNRCGPNLFVVVHASVLEDETAFGGCTPGDTGSRWWSYTEYTPACCCFCGFSFDNQHPESEACLTLPYNGVPYKFWSNNFMFSDTQNYEVSLVANAKTCTPLNMDGTKTAGENYETIIVGKAILDVYTGGDGGTERFVNITYELKDKYKYYDIQLDLYIGADQKPLGWDLEHQTIVTDDKHMLFQHELASGDTAYTFTGIPWLTHDGENMPTYIALHAAIGDCPMPTLQDPMGLGN